MRLKQMMIRLQALSGGTAGFSVASFNSLSYEQEFSLANKTMLPKSPCFMGGSTAVSCYETVMRLAYLNQQSDGGSLSLRRGKKCLTQTGACYLPSAI
jgi:hypothetical protein